MFEINKQIKMAKIRRTNKKSSAVQMAYFDLNIPYNSTDSSGKLSIPRKKSRLKTLIKSLELGYTGIAYNHSIKASAMSNSDICTITPIPLTSILQASPNLFTTVKFHREILGVPITNPFRQFTRLTVTVDNIVQTKALNLQNLVIKSYDLVAVRPLNQVTFDEVAKNPEIDVIAIDFSDKIPFRMDYQTVKKAIDKFGIYFEITYSHLISDVHARKQMIANSKLLMEWTRGKNIIFSSAATSANELRGPSDVVNLSSLLGLPMKRAKSAISENCRALLENALRKKRYYRNAIKVERISPRILDSNEAWICDDDGKGWDPISSGEGDLMLDGTSEIPKPSKAMDLGSVADEMMSSGFSLKNVLSTTL